MPELLTCAYIDALTTHPLMPYKALLLVIAHAAQQLINAGRCCRPGKIEH